MSRYDDYEDYDRPRRRRGGARTREPEYIATEETYVQKGPGIRDLALRGRGDDYDAIDYRRDSYRDDYGPPRRARSQGVRDRDSYYGDDYHSDYNPRARRSRRSRDDDYSYYSDDYDRPRERRKSRVEGVLDDIGLGGVVAAVVGKSRSRSRHRRRDGDDFYSDRSRSHSRGHDTRKKWQQAAKAAVISGVIEAVRSRKEPGGWTGAKGTRIATAALGAAGIDGLIDRDPDHRSKRHIVESVVGGLAANHLANGPRDASRSRGRSQSRSRSESRGRSRSQSQTVIGRLRSASRSVLRGRSSSRGPDRASGSGPGIKDLAALGGVAAIGKAVFDRVRSKSRGRLGRDHSVSSDDSYVPSRRQRYGQNNGNRSRGGPDRGYGPTNEQKNQRQVMKRGRQAESAVGEPDDDGDRAARGTNNNNDKNRNRSSSSSSISTTDLERRRKKTRGKELLTAGLATVATIHAAHGVYNSMVASEKRHKMVMEGEMSPDEARKRKSKNMLQDAAAVGIAALGIKSAYSEWKEMNESRKEKHELEARHRRHRRARGRREREMKERQLGLGQGSGGYGTPAYGDANPYHAYAGATYPGNFPPPPGGGPPR